MATPIHCILRQVRSILAEHDADRMTDRELLGRFAEWREEAAFTALVRRHGPMALAVCRRVLHSVCDAEDALQATFLILARKAKARSWGECVGPWLYRVAYRVALRIRATARRRRLVESRAIPKSTDDPLAVISGRELCQYVDAELHLLPERLRAPIVLCCLEGQTRDEAAGQLGWSLATLKRRLDKGRERLALRLQRHGFALPAALASLMAVEGAQSALPRALVEQVIVAATTSVVASARVAALSQEVLKNVLLSKGKVVAAALLAACTVFGLATGLAVTSSPGGNQPPQAKTAALQEAKKETITDSRRPRTDRYGDPLPVGAVAHQPERGRPAILPSSRRFSLILLRAPRTVTSTRRELRHDRPCRESRFPRRSPDRLPFPMHRD
jgi:RNA polymerase sigma factor (sigma-70 family)